MSGHILLATDFSTRSDRALRRAVLLARQLEARLSLVHVVDDDQPANMIKWQVSASLSVLEECARTVSEYDGVPAEARIVTGDPAAGILAAAEEGDADFIMLGAHRRKLRDMFRGTTAERTVARSRRPVLIAAGVPSAPYRRALLALDLEEHSKAVTRRARELGLIDGGEIVAMHAFEAPALRMMQRSLSEKQAIDQYVLAEEAAAADELGRFAAASAILPVRQRVLPMIGSASRTIVESAIDEDAQLIIVGTSQRKGLERLVIGSVAEKVLSDADRDVLVIPK